jgi:hypothetical protein
MFGHGSKKEWGGKEITAKKQKIYNKSSLNIKIIQTIFFILLTIISYIKLSFIKL